MHDLTELWIVSRQLFDVCFKVLFCVFKWTLAKLSFNVLPLNFPTVTDVVSELGKLVRRQNSFVLFNNKLGNGVVVNVVGKVIQLV